MPVSSIWSDLRLPAPAWWLLMVFPAERQCVRRVTLPHFRSLRIMCRPFQAMRSPRMESFLTENRGWGVRASQPIRKGTFIVEYAGKPVGADVIPAAAVSREAAASGIFMRFWPASVRWGL